MHKNVFAFMTHWSNSNTLDRVDSIKFRLTIMKRMTERADQKAFPNEYA